MCKGRPGRMFCCSTFIGMHLAGIVSLGLFVFFFTLMIKSIDYDEFNGLVLIWLIAIEAPRIVFWILHCKDSIPHRKYYALILVATTLGEAAFYVVNQIIIFTNDKDYCRRVYAIEYMEREWNIECDWAITCYEMCTSTSLIFFCYASVGAYEHYQMGYRIPKLEI